MKTKKVTDFNRMCNTSKQYLYVFWNERIQTERKKGFIAYLENENGTVQRAMYGKTKKQAIERFEKNIYY